VVVFGELGLGGELRAVTQTTRRLSEARKLGFERCVLPREAKVEPSDADGMQLLRASSLVNALSLALEQEDAQPRPAES